MSPPLVCIFRAGRCESNLPGAETAEGHPLHDMLQGTALISGAAVRSGVTAALVQRGDRVVDPVEEQHAVEMIDLVQDAACFDAVGGDDPVLARPGEDAADDDLVFAEDEKRLKQALESRAGAIVAGEFAATGNARKPLLISSQPKLSFARAAHLLVPRRSH